MISCDSTTLVLPTIVVQGMIIIATILPSTEAYLDKVTCYIIIIIILSFPELSYWDLQLFCVVPPYQLDLNITL